MRFGNICKVSDNMSIFDFFKKDAAPNVNDGTAGNDISMNNQINRFSFDNFETDLPEILDIAEYNITMVIESMGKRIYHEWSWTIS